MAQLIPLPPSTAYRPEIAAIIHSAPSIKDARIRMWAYINSREWSLDEYKALSTETFVAINDWQGPINAA